MKIIISILLLSFMIQTSWTDNLNRKIEEIDLNSKEISHDVSSDNEYVYLQAKYEIDNKFKTVFRLENKELNSFNFDCKIYQEKDFIFASFSTIIEPILYKGKSDTIRPKFKLEESKKYFKNDSVGIKYNRTIYVFDYQNIDSLKIELKKKPFINKNINYIDYLHEFERFERFLKKVKTN